MNVLEIFVVRYFGSESFSGEGEDATELADKKKKSKILWKPPKPVKTRQVHSPGVKLARDSNRYLGMLD